MSLLTLLTCVKNARLGPSNLRHTNATFAQLTEANNIKTAPAGCSLWPRSSAFPLPGRRSWHVWTPPSAAALLRLQHHMCWLELHNATPTTTTTTTAAAAAAAAAAATVITIN